MKVYTKAHDRSQYFHFGVNAQRKLALTSNTVMRMFLELCSQERNTGTSPKDNRKNVHPHYCVVLHFHKYSTLLFQIFFTKQRG